MQVMSCSKNTSIEEMDFPDPEEEFDMMYAEELELMRELEDQCSHADRGSCPKSKRSLDFSSPKAPSPVAPALGVMDDVELQLPEVLPAAPQTDVGLPGDSDRKRKVTELFGDISDMELEDLDSLDSLCAKRQRQATGETDADLIKRIKAQRQLVQAQTQSRHVLGDSPHSDVNTSNVTWRVPRYPFVSVACRNGERMYVRLRSEEYFERQISSITAQSRTMGLLSIPYQSLWDQAQLYIQKKLDQAEADQNATETATEPIDTGCATVSGEEDNVDLWVEKYKPKSYLELLSDEGANRTLLRWLKLWDKVVFNSERKIKHKGKQEGKKENFQKFGSVLNDELDEHGCPQQKVALLCGPPGLGKTTLAHMVGTHAGYNVVEMNASDDRSPDAFRTQLEAATQMRSVMGTEPRPNCLVLDEIDGAPSASIDVLIKFVLGRDTGKVAHGKKKRRGGGVLKRPVVCICNDVYVPALRSLRQIALIVQFPPTASSRLAQRLLEIARKQHMKTDMRALVALAEKSHNDIRSCLSVLHFFKSQKKDVRLVDIQKSSIGLKDVQKGLFTVWREVFQIQRPKRKTYSTASVARNGILEPMPDLNSPEMKFGDMSLASRMHSVLQTVQSCSDYDRLVQGVYENFLNMSFRDNHLNAVSLGLEWFCAADVLSHKIHTTQNYVLMPYQPFGFVAWHFLFASLSWPKIAYPSAGYEMSVREQRARQVLKELMRGMAPLVRMHSGAAQLRFDTLPLLLQILVPALRPVSLQLYNAHEKKDLNHVISVMIDYSLNYVQERTQDGSYVYNLDPNIEELTLFPGQKPARFLGYGSKQMISREVELEKMRRTEARTQSDGGAIETASSGRTVLPNHLQTLKPKTVAGEVQCRDFFGRVVQQRKKPTDAGQTDEIVKSDIWYHYKEGFSNAVRRSVKMQDLLGAGRM
ncbi:chromosome transmission fidelity protein 18 homolog isoform X2 [Zootermopsis nevadensis]|uniref:chromosome transmission fidelity protein 18 homolog isoform X2 n=1 Tax=Zootermopsis nevadensis TaxID=136037 RepID=UPI000B8E4F70|nr:chromosome transmission fidelity protein 18 homolog isoform X2 [Zootermopsis nevadensis]